MLTGEAARQGTWTWKDPEIKSLGDTDLLEIRFLLLQTLGKYLVAYARHFIPIAQRLPSSPLRCSIPFRTIEVDHIPFLRIHQMFQVFFSWLPPPRHSPRSPALPRMEAFSWRAAYREVNSDHATWVCYMRLPRQLLKCARLRREIQSPQLHTSTP